MAPELQAQGQPAPPAPVAPAPSEPSVATGVGAQATPTPEPVILDNSPGAVYEGLINQRRELMNQLARLNDQREDISDEISEAHTAGVTATVGGLEARLQAVDQRIASVEAQLAIADASVARAAAIPGAIVPPPPPPPERGPPEGFFVLAGIFMFVVVFPMAIAYSRRIWRRGAAVATQIPQELWSRFTRVEQSLDSIAIEVERIGEGQRYLTRVYTERGIGTGAAQPIESHQRVGDRIDR